MAVSTTPRLGINRWSAGTDAWPARGGWDTQQQKLDDLTAIDQQGTIALRPVAGVRGRYYFTTDTRKLYRDDGVQWNEIGPNGGVVPTALTFGGAAAEGTSARSARADHKHALPAHDDAAHAGVQLSALAAPTAPVNMGGQKLTGLGAPTVGDDAATRQFAVDQVAGLITDPDAPSTVAFGAGGAVGVSSKAARADHTHPFPATAWDSYVPTWLTSGNAPSLGNGTLTGAYKQLGKLVTFRIRILMGSTTTYGTGEWRLSYPVGAATSPVGGLSGYVFRSGPQYWGLIGVGFATNSFRMIGSAGNALVTGTAPVAFAAGDELLIGGTYEAA
ncbi:hypothetical protein [Kribbella catacumbae]|uniref:hypothetical protein n=1 Tax=Kribbella catacumbae TaxID=460086 RepID=UPI00036E0315|nr:hypothetical protein [Kribbella catacumbae]